MLIEVVGKLEFEPEVVTRKQAAQSIWKRTAMIRTDCDMHLYYAWFLERRFGLKLNKPLRGTHVTFVNDRMEREAFDEATSVFNGKSIRFYIDPEPRTNVEHWWLRAYSPDTEAIRKFMGLEPIPFFTLHMTIGLTHPKQIEHSRYILECCKSFGLTTNGPRLPFESHEIAKFS